MNQYLIYILLLIASLLASCKPDALEKEVTPVNPKMVINTLISPDTALWISVTRSNVHLPDMKDGSAASYSDFIQAISINDAIVTLTGNNHTDTLTLESMGLYKLAHLPVYADKVYQLTVYCRSTGETAIGFSTLPSKSRISHYRAFYRPSMPNAKLQLEVTFDDNSKTKDFYVASYFASNLGNWEENPQYFYNLLNKKRSDFDLVNDEKATSGSINLNKSFPKECISDTLTFMISEVEEGYYRFLEQHKLSGGMLSQLAGEVVRYQSNIIGGYGYFSLRWPDMVRIAPATFELDK